ncbi:LOW QUALITY PROTEIN: regulator of MON1-CCZ1 complex-like [Pollicipes pollicipes]|uniref:LOW QUALITY PROTEIN: regulator of MON1-CCZ1 complex-like n=1 Tax=Pollicipes pollicipes TaxID=41117 RepID=UPI0018855827|nr:LOW QUALITY PROTEIN: regulator of MON1-CCZ1 complex-like [Pollicipes pollicipes]
MAVDQESTDSLLFLNTELIRFEPVNKVTAVFFDESNKQIFAVRSGGATGVVAKSLDPTRNASFRMEDRGPVISIKFSPDQKVLAIQRNKTSVEYVNFSGEPDTVEYSQGCRSRSATILDFVWVADTELVYVTDRGVEHYQVLPARRQLKSLKNSSLSINWSVFSARFSYLLVSSGALGNTLQPFTFKPGTMTKLTKFDVELMEVPRPARLALHAHDVTLCELHGQLAVLALQHGAAAGSPSSSSSPGHGAEIRLHQANRDGAMVKNSTLLLNTSGSFAISVIDNLIIVHHQESKTSQVFDITLSGESDGCVTFQRAVAPPAAIRPFQLRLPTAAAALDSEPTLITCELYAPSWVVFQPNIIIDAKLGCFWTLAVAVEAVPRVLADPVAATRLLLARRAGKPVLLGLLRQLLRQPGRLGAVGDALDLVNAQTQRQLEHTVSSQMGTPVSAIGTSPTLPATRPVPFVISQADLHGEALSALVDRDLLGRADQRWVTGVLVECVRSLNQHGLAVEHFLYEMLINTLVLRGCFYQLQQLLQYHVVDDSKPLACLLLSLQSVYPPSEQMALDMLCRLGNAHEEILEVLLSRNCVACALKFARQNDMIESLSARKFLDVAKNTGDSDVFYTTFKFFEERNYQSRGKVDFLSGEHCDPYVRHFSQLFGASSSIREALEAAQRREDGL